MDPLIIYTICFCGPLGLLLIINCFGSIRRCWPPGFMVKLFHRWSLSSPHRGNGWIRRRSWNELLIQIAYWTCTLLFNGLKVKGAAGIASRAASLAVVHFIVLLAGSRLHLVADTLGVHISSFTHIHRTAGWMTVLQGTIHVVASSRIEQIRWSSPGHREGIMAALCLLALVLVLVKPVRRYAYDISTKLHFSLSVCCLVFSWAHLLRIMPGLSVSEPNFSLVCLEVASGLLLISTFTQAGRIIYRNLCFGKPSSTATIYRDNEGNRSEGGPPRPLKLRVRIPRGWNVHSGQTVYVFLHTMRVTSLFQAHPFTISWWEGPSITHTAHRPLDDDALEDMKIIGRGTDQEASDISRKGDLYIWLVVQSQWGVNKKLSGLASNTNLRAIVDGPYGSHSSLERFGHVVLFTQGAGITAQIPYVKELFYGSLAGRLRVRRISLIWETQEEDLVIVQPWMKAILTEDHDHHKNTMMLHVQLYLVNQTASLRYGRRVRSFPGSVDLGSVLNREIEKQCGAMLVTGGSTAYLYLQRGLLSKTAVSASETFVESLRGHLLNHIKRGNLKEVELRCLDSQPQGAPQLVRGNAVSV